MLENVIAEVRRHSSKEGSAEGLVERLESMSNTLSKVLEATLEIQNYVPLEVESVEQVGDQIDLDSLSIPELQDRSQLINAIYRSGVTIKGRYVFSNLEIGIAKTIAADFNSFSKPLAAFRGAKFSKEKSSWSMLFDGGHAGFQFLQALGALGVIEIQFILFRKDDKWVKFNIDWAKTTNSDQKFLAVFDRSDPKIHDFLKGDWMTAFVSEVISDHLQRNAIKHELFSKVAYEAPADIIKSRSDFDVISLLETHKTAFCFECKSGKMSEAEVNEVAEKGLDIKRVLEKFAPGIDKVELFLVYDHHLNNEEQIRNLFGDTKVLPKRIDQVRELVLSWY